VYNPETGEYDYTCSDYRAETTLISVNCVKNGGPLQSWNGVRPDGTNILNWKKTHPFQIPSMTPRPRTPGAVVILDTTCAEEIQILPGSRWGLSLQMNKVVQLYNFVYDRYRSRLDCESKLRQFKLDDSIFAANYFLPSFFAMLTSPVTSEIWASNFIPNVRTFAENIFNDKFEDQTRIVLPKTCDYNSWKSNGKCQLTYDGLASLFGLDIKFNLAISKCDFREYPSIYVECVGHDCNIFQSLIPCDPNGSSCPNQNCVSGKDLLSEMTQGNNNDFVAEAMGTTTPNCPSSNTTMIMNDYKAILRRFGINENSNICMPNFERMSQNFEAWSQTQFYESNRAIVLTYVTEWQSPI